jgi:hypothetical protein
MCWKFISIAYFEVGSWSSAQKVGLMECGDNGMVMPNWFFFVWKMPYWFSKHDLGVISWLDVSRWYVVHFTNFPSPRNYLELCLLGDTEMTSFEAYKGSGS